MPYLSQYGFDADKHFVMVHSIEEAWRLVLLGKVDLLIDDVTAISPMLRFYGDPSKKVKAYFPIKELNVPGYLAASKHTDPSTVKNLKSAFERLRKKGEYPLEQEYGRWLDTNAQ